MSATSVGAIDLVAAIQTDSTVLAGVFA